MEDNKCKKTSSYRIEVYEFEKEGDVVVEIYKGPSVSNILQPVCTYAGAAATNFIKDFHN